MRYNAAWMTRSRLITGLLLILGASEPVCAQQARPRAVVIGIRRYAKYPLTRPLLYSDNDAQLIRDFVRGSSPARFDPRDVTLLTDEAAGLHAMNIAFRKVLLGAGEGDYIYVFISARGIARPGAGDGYLGTADLIEVKPESTGLPVSDLHEWIRYSHAKRVFLFADVCRDPPSLPFENRINIRLGELGNISKVAGILASERERLSFEKKELPPRAPRGLGVFTYVLIDAMPSGGTSLAAVFDSLKRTLPAVALPNRQLPQQVGKSAEAWTAPLWLAGPGHAMGVPVLLASAWFEPGLLAPYQAAGSEILGPDRLRQPESVVEQIQNLRGKLQADDWEDLRDRAAAALAGSGQRFVAAYGIEDLLPEDPRKLEPQDFFLAARSFAAATKLLPSDARFESYRRQLEGLARFCTGRALAFDRTRLQEARAALESARKTLPKPIPEIENVIGITYLDEGSDYAAAAERFKAAKRASPGWPYPRHNLALAYAEQGDYRAAEREYRDAIRQMPDQPYLRYNLGLLLQKMSRKKQARAELIETVGRLEAVSQSYAERSKEWSTSLPEESALAFERASLMLRARGEAENVLGAVYESLNDFGRAEAAYRRALNADWGLCPARHNLALLFRRHGRGDPHPLLEENVHRCESFHPSIVLLAQLHLEEGLREKARVGFERALALAPENAESALGLARILTADRQFGRAAETLTNLIRRTEPAAHPLLYVELANVYEAQASPLVCAAYRRALEALKGTTDSAGRRRIEHKVKLCPG